MEKSLTDAVVEYQETGENWSELAERLYVYAYEYPGKAVGWEHDACCDFLLTFCARIPGLVNRYEPDRSFEAYFTSTIRWCMRSFREKQASEHFYIGWTAMESIRRLEYLPDVDPEQYGEFVTTHSPEITDYPLEINSKGQLIRKSHRERLLCLILLHAADVELSEIPVIAKLTNVDSLWLDAIMERARATISNKIEQREIMRNQRNEYWYNLMRSKNRMQLAKQGLSMRNIEYWAQKIKTWQTRYHTATRRLARLKVDVSHKDIGKLMNLPPGSVSSGLFLLRKELRKRCMDKAYKTSLQFRHADNAGQRQHPQNGRISTDTDASPNLYSRQIWY